MLREVYLCLKENIACSAEPLAEDLREHGIHVVPLSYAGEDDGAGTVVGRMKRMWERIPGKQETDVLYITDSEEAYRALLKQGGYVLPYRHEGNRETDFTGARYVIEQLEEVGYETVDMAYRRLAGLPWEILTTKRCIVRETTEEDVDSFYRIYAEPEITRYMEDLYADREEEHAYIRDYREKVYGFYGYGMWTVLTKDGTVIGRAGISWREGYDMPELGFVIGVPWQRQGYAYEVCGAILDYAGEELGLTQIQALVMTENKKSRSLCEKLGFQCLEEVADGGERYVRMVREG